MTTKIRTLTEAECLALTVRALVLAILTVGAA